MPANFERRPSEAQVASAVAVWPPHEILWLEIRIFDRGPSASGRKGRRYT